MLTLGRATRLTRFLINAPKVYSGSIQLGATTDTYDAAGEVTGEKPIDGITDDDVAAAMAARVGTFQQAAPAYSAKKHKGVKYYEMARRGEEVPEAFKEVKVYDFELTGGIEDGSVDFQLGCSSGTYVRSLAHELGETLGCGAHLASLRRLKVGPFAIEKALPMEEIRRRTEAGEELGDAWIPFDEIPLPFSGVVADAQQELRVTHGQPVLVRELDCEEGDWIKLVNRRRQLIAVGSVVERIGESGAGVIQPKIVFKG